jgi:hypothetical protein
VRVLKAHLCTVLFFCFVLRLNLRGCKRMFLHEDLV